jgi:hypothetical protein
VFTKHLAAINDTSAKQVGGGRGLGQIEADIEEVRRDLLYIQGESSRYERAVMSAVCGKSFHSYYRVEQNPETA